MKDREIVKWLCNLKPESSKQQEKIKDCIKILDVKEPVNQFFNGLDLVSFNTKTPESLYYKYCTWCIIKGFPKVDMKTFKKLYKSH